MVRCRDCKLPYKEMGLDLVLSNEQWLRVWPSDGGVLCANCICLRAAQLPGTSVIKAVIE